MTTFKKKQPPPSKMMSETETLQMNIMFIATHILS